MNSRRNNTIY